MDNFYISTKITNNLGRTHTLLLQPTLGLVTNKQNLFKKSTITSLNDLSYTTITTF